MGNLIEDRGTLGMVSSIHMLCSIRWHVTQRNHLCSLLCTFLLKVVLEVLVVNVECTLWFIPLSIIYLFLSDVMESEERNEKVTFILSGDCSEKEKLLSRNILKCWRQKKKTGWFDDQNWRIKFQLIIEVQITPKIHHIILLFAASMTNFAQIDSWLYLKINLFSLRKNYSNRRFCDTRVIAVCSVIALITRKLRIQCRGPWERRTWVWVQVVHLLTGAAHIYHSTVHLWSVVNMWLWFDIYGPIWSTW